MIRGRFRLPPGPCRHRASWPGHEVPRYPRCLPSITFIARAGAALPGPGNAAPARGTRAENLPRTGAGRHAPAQLEPAVPDRARRPRPDVPRDVGSGATRRRGPSGDFPGSPDGVLDGPQPPGCSGAEQPGERSLVVMRLFARGAQRPAVHRLQADPPQALPVGPGDADVQVAVPFGRDLFRVLLAEQPEAGWSAPSSGLPSASRVKYASWAIRSPVTTIPWADTVTGTRVLPDSLTACTSCPRTGSVSCLAMSAPSCRACRVVPGRYPQAQRQHRSTAVPPATRKGPR